MEDIIQYFQTKSHSEILDPFSCLIRISLLKHKQPNTKLCIYHNSLLYDEPTLYQGVIRHLRGDTRDDIQNLYNPILKAIQWYDLSKENYQYCFRQCIDGFLCLQKTYPEESIIHTTLQHYCQLIQDALDGKTPTNTKKETPFIQKIKSHWEPPEVHIIYKTLKFLNESHNQTYLTVIEEIVTMKEKKLHNYILQSCSSYHEPSEGKSESDSKLKEGAETTSPLSNEGGR